MKYKIDTTNNSNSVFKNEEYFPFIIEYVKEETNNNFIQYYYKDSDLLELTVDKHTNIVKKVCLTLCNHYESKKSKLPIPNNYKEGIIYATYLDSANCSIFKLTIYNDGAKLQISLKEEKYYIKYGQLIFSFSKNNDIISIYITELTKKDIQHIVDELQQ